MVFCQGKTLEHAAGIFERLWANHDRVLGTRATPEMAGYVQARLPQARYDPLSRLICLSRPGRPRRMRLG